jgi:hypothetical protein
MKSTMTKKSTKTMPMKMAGKKTAAKAKGKTVGSKKSSMKEMC